MSLAYNGKLDLSVAEATPNLLSGGSWSAPGTGTTVSYSFRATAPATMPDSTGGFGVFNPQQIQAAQLAMQAWSDVANIHFAEVLGPGGSPYSDAGTIRFADYSTGQADAAAFTYLPGPYGDRSASSDEGDSWYNSALSYNANPQLYNYGQQVLVHEIGHAIGLSHPSNYDASPTPITYAANASFFEDSRQYTVMSYFSEQNTGAYYGGHFASAPQLLDIAAAQDLYGANMSAFLGDTTYGFNSNAGRPWFTATGPNSTLIFSVWDAGGNDTFDFSGYSNAQKIDLNAGDFSDVGGLTGNVSIAEGVTIENAIGGSGSDSILGNAVGNVILGLDGADTIDGGAGDDSLNGNQGNDQLHGGAGGDTVLGGQGADTLWGDAGVNLLNGNKGDDLVYAGPQGDTLYGGQGDDTLHGGDGADVLSGDLGNDILFGGKGADRFLFRPGGGVDWVGDFNSAEGDRIVLPTGTPYAVTTYQGQAVIDLGHGDTIGLAGVAPAQMGEWLVYA